MKKNSFLALYIMILFATCLLPSVASSEQIFDGGAPCSLVDCRGTFLTTDVGASDFVVTEPSVLTDAHFWTLEPFTITRPDDETGTLQYSIFNDDSGLPADSPLTQGIAQNVTKAWTGWQLPLMGFSIAQYEYSFDLENPVNLSANTTYWLALFFVDHISDPSWEKTDTISGYPLAFGEYRPISDDYFWFTGEGDHAFYLTGNTTVPEPSTLLLLGFGLAGVGLLRKRAKN